MSDSPLPGEFEARRLAETLTEVDYMLSYGMVKESRVRISEALDLFGFSELSTEEEPPHG